MQTVPESWAASKTDRLGRPQHKGRKLRAAFSRSERLSEPQPVSNFLNVKTAADRLIEA